jgi:hypothetical protein
MILHFSRIGEPWRAGMAQSHRRLAWRSSTAHFEFDVCAGHLTQTEFEIGGSRRFCRPSAALAKQFGLGQKCTTVANARRAIYRCHAWDLCVWSSDDSWMSAHVRCRAARGLSSLPGLPFHTGSAREALEET